MKLSLAVVLTLMPFGVYAGVHRQVPSQLVDPAIASPTYINALPAAVDVTPMILRGPSETLSVTPSRVTSPSAIIPATAVSGTTSPTALPLSLVAQHQCVAGLRVLTQLSLVGYDADPSKAFMRLAAAAAIAEPYAANGVAPNLKGIQSAIDDLPFNGTGVKEINQAFGITRTACASIVKSR
jgi:hypothetical protein